MNKDNSGQHCHKKMGTFTPFILSVDEILGKEAQVSPTTLSRLMATKM